MSEKTIPAAVAADTAGGLSCEGLVAGYGNVPVVRDIDLHVAPGSVLAILGPNGAGKTTLMLTLAGLLPRLGGKVLLGNQELPSRRPAAVNKAGVVLVPDNRALFTRLTVRENLQIARKYGGLTLDQVIELFPALVKRLRVAAGSLSGGEQQMLAVARGLVQGPRVLLIDEMSMGLAPVIVEELLPVVRRIANETATAVVIVEQHIRLALELADQAAVLVHGEVALTGRAGELIADMPRVEAAYLGDSAHVG